MNFFVKNAADLVRLDAVLHDRWIDVDELALDGDVARAPLSERATRRAVAADFRCELSISPVIELLIDDQERVRYYDLDRVELDEEPVVLRLRCNIPILIELHLAALPAQVTITTKTGGEVGGTRYLVWTRSELDGLHDLGIHRLFTEVSDSGAVEREVGVDSEGRIVHRSPSSKSRYGLFDNQLVEAESGSELEPEAFEDYWSREL